MKITDLKKIDLKDIDLNKIQESLIQKPDLLINLAIIFFSGVLVFNIVSGRTKEVQKLKTKTIQLEKKIAAIKTHDATQKEFQELVANLPSGIREDSLVDHVTDFAGKRNIRILSFSPPSKIKKKYNTQMTVSLNVTAKNYKDMIRFINDIENSAYNLRVDRWTGSMEREKDAKKSEKGVAQEGAIIAQIEINAINFIK